MVETFAERTPDEQLMALLADAPKSMRVLDLGCAGGRNTVWLAQSGFDFYALDSSSAMLEKTRSRVAAYVGTEEARRRVVRSQMEDLSAFESGFFDLVVCYGVYHCAQSIEEWHRALSETARVLKPGGRLLMSQFSPRSNLSGKGSQALEPHIYLAFEGRRMLLLEPEELDTWMAPHGLTPLEPTRVLTVPSDEGGTRVIVKGLYTRFG